MRQEIEETLTEKTNNMLKILKLFFTTIIAGCAIAVAKFAYATGTFTFIDWGEENTTDLIANISAVIGDLTPLLTIVVGIGIGLIVVGAIISAIRGHN